MGCIHCGLVLEGEAIREPGHLSGEDCPECGARLRIVDRSEAEQLVHERFLAAHWLEVAASKKATRHLDEGSSQRGTRSGAREFELPPGLRRPLFQRIELDTDPRLLRETLASLERLLAASAPDARRRALLTFGELVAAWQAQFAGEPISVVVERLPYAVRLTLRNSNRPLSPGEWTEVVPPSVVDIVDQWGIDRRLPGRAWFEFRWEPDDLFESHEGAG